MDEKIRGAKYHLTAEKREVARKIALLLAESKATYLEVNEILQAARQELKVHC